MTNIKDALTEDIDSLRSTDGYLNAGTPNYNHLFGRDACVSAIQLLDFDQDIARSTIGTMAKYQATRRSLMHEAYPGKMPHEHFPTGTKHVLLASDGLRDNLRRLYIFLFWRFPYYGTVDTGAWFIILLHRYFKKTGDEEFLRAMWPAALAVVSWLEARASNRPSELVAYRRTYIFGLLNQSWKDTISSTVKPPTSMVEVQGYYHEAYNCLSELALQVFHDTHLGDRFALKADTLKRSFNAHFWDDDTGYLSLAINDHGERDPSVTSNPGHLLFTGILSEKQAESVVDRLMQEDLLTPYGIRTLSSTDETFDATSYQEGGVWPFDNWVIYQGLLKNGFGEEADTVKKGLLAAYDKLGNIPEMYVVSEENKLARYPHACTVQAWSAGALMNMTTSSEPIL